MERDRVYVLLGVIIDSDGPSVLAPNPCTIDVPDGNTGFWVLKRGAAVVVICLRVWCGVLGSRRDLAGTGMGTMADEFADGMGVSSLRDEEELVKAGCADFLPELEDVATGNGARDFEVTIGAALRTPGRRLLAVVRDGIGPRRVEGGGP